MADLKKILVVGSEYSAGHNEDMHTFIDDLKPHATELQVRCTPFNSTEGVMRDMFGFIRSLGRYNEPGLEKEVSKWCVVVELPNPFNRTVWIEDYDTSVNICGDTKQIYVNDKEMRENPTQHFNAQVDDALERLNAWRAMLSPYDIYNEQAKAAGLATSFFQSMGADGCLVCFDQTHMPGGDVVRSVYEPYMMTGNHWFAPIMSDTVREIPGALEVKEHKCYMSSEGHTAYSKKLLKYMRQRGLLIK